MSGLGIYQAAKNEKFYNGMLKKRVWKLPYRKVRESVTDRNRMKMQLQQAIQPWIYIML